MIKSMTAFSRQDQFEAGIELSWEIRSVNHRYLDISLHLPEVFNAQENALKETIKKYLARGKLDATLTYKTTSGENNGAILINEDKVKALLKARKKLEALSKTPMSLSVIEILNWPEVIGQNTNDRSNNLAITEVLFKKALNDLVDMREQEGARLSSMILSRCSNITGLVKLVRLRRQEVQKSLREKVLKRIAELEITVDNNRLEQELVYQAQRLDVDEELDRIDSHIEEVQAVLKRDEAVGRRLDFLMQELNREANTLASKSNDVETTKSAVELKVLIEQMREQCLNIE